MPELKRKGEQNYRMVDKRAMNSLCIEALNEELKCSDRDVSRFFFSEQVSSCHPLPTIWSTFPNGTVATGWRCLLLVYPATACGSTLSMFRCSVWRPNSRAIHRSASMPLPHSSSVRSKGCANPLSAPYFCPRNWEPTTPTSSTSLPPPDVSRNYLY